MRRFAALLLMLPLLGAGCSLTQSTSVDTGTKPGVEDDGRMEPLPNGSDEPSGEERAAVGTVTSVNLEGVAVDGPAVVTLESETDGEVVVHVPSFGILLCPAVESIADVYALAEGDRVEVRGSAGSEGGIVPCDSEDHYLRVIAE